MTMKKFLLYLPYFEFIDSYEHKALGGIPIGFVQAGYDTILIVALMKSERYRENNIKIYETGNQDGKYIPRKNSHGMTIIPRVRNLLNFSEYRKVVKILEEEKPDIMMAYNNSTLTWLIMLRYKLYCKFNNVKTKLILKLDNDGNDLIDMKGLRKIFLKSYYLVLAKIFDDIITETTCGYEVFTRLLGIGKKLRVVPNTIFDDFLENKNVLHRDKNVIAVSRIVRLKGLDKLIDSFHIVSKKHPDWHLKIIGPPDDPEYLSSLIKMVDSYDLREKIFFIGERSRKELIEIYNQSPIYCLFSTSESFSISRLEAIAMGLYVITTDAGCARDFSKYGIHIMNDANPESGARYIEEGIEAIEGGSFNGSDVDIPSYKDIAMQIAGIIDK